jgi:hypothetical protein
VSHDAIFTMLCYVQSMTNLCIMTNFCILFFIPCILFLIVDIFEIISSLFFSLCHVLI